MLVMTGCQQMRVHTLDFEIFLMVLEIERRQKLPQNPERMTFLIDGVIFVLLLQWLQYRKQEFCVVMEDVISRYQQIRWQLEFLLEDFTSTRSHVWIFLIQDIEHLLIILWLQGFRYIRMKIDFDIRKLDPLARQDDIKLP